MSEIKQCCYRIEETRGLYRYIRGVTHCPFCWSVIRLEEEKPKTRWYKHKFLVKEFNEESTPYTQISQKNWINLPYNEKKDCGTYKLISEIGIETEETDIAKIYKMFENKKEI